jgi:thiol-disulfide isomerase/thioredoxin
MRKQWKGLALSLAAVALIAGTTQMAVAGENGEKKTGADIGDFAPNFEVYTLDGKKVTLEDYRGKPLFVNFWAWWCPPCIREAEALMQLAEKYKGRIEFAFIGINRFYRDNKPLDPAEFEGGVAVDMAEFVDGLKKARLVRPDSTIIREHPEQLPEYEARNQKVIEYYLTSPTSLFDFRGYWERQLRAETNERYGIPVTYLIDGEGRIRLDVNPNDQYWHQNDDILEDFIAGKDLAHYRDRFPIPPHHQPKPQTAVQE